jgi:CheY-like chemotaxis protein
LTERVDAAQLLHRLRSTLATLRTELELAIDDAAPPAAESVTSADRALALVGELEDQLIGDDRAANTQIYAPGDGARRVIVADDDQRLAQLLGRRLRRLGYEVTVMSSLSALASKLAPDDTLIVDLSLLQNLDDWTAASIKAARPIVVSGAVHAKAPDQARELGAIAYLVKPLQMDQLEQALRSRRSEAQP